MTADQPPDVGADPPAQGIKIARRNTDHHQVCDKFVLQVDIRAPLIEERLTAENLSATRKNCRSEAEC
jgi:hypothetical protein